MATADIYVYRPVVDVGRIVFLINIKPFATNVQIKNTKKKYDYVNVGYQNSLEPLKHRNVYNSILCCTELIFLIIRSLFKCLLI